MAKYQSLRPWQRILYSRPVIVVLILLVIGLVRAIWLVYPQMAGAKKAESEAAAAYQAALDRQSDLEAKVKALNTERGREALIRLKFPVAKEGEHVITVIPPPATPK